MIKKNYMNIGIGAFIGANMRYIIGLWIHSSALHSYTIPLDTLLANIIGAIIIGIFAGWIVFINQQRLTLVNHLRMFWMTGLCGGITTFSTFAENTVHLMNEGTLSSVRWAMVNIVLNVSLSFVAFWLSYKLVASFAKISPILVIVNRVRRTRGVGTRISILSSILIFITIIVRSRRANVKVSTKSVKS